MKRIQLLAGALLLGLTLPACDAIRDDDDADVNSYSIYHADTVDMNDYSDPGHAQRSGVPQLKPRYDPLRNPVRLNRVGIDEPASTMDMLPQGNVIDNYSAAVNQRIHRIKDTTSIGRQITTRGIETDRFYNPINRSGELAGTESRQGSQGLDNHERGH